VAYDALAYTDAERTLPQLRQRLKPGGAIALVERLTERSYWWQQAADAVADAWFGPAPPGPTGPDPFTALADAGCTPGFGHAFAQRRLLDAEEAVRLQYTRPGRDPRLLGGQWPAFEVEVRDALAAAVPDGQFPWAASTELLIATARTAP